MKIRLFSFLLCLFFLPFIVSAQKPDTTGAGILFQNAMSQINPKHVSWVKNSAKTMNEKNMSESDVRNMAAQYAVLGSMNGQDIEALAFLVLMQAAKSAQEDLKGIMAKVKSINEQKKKMRDALAKLNEKNAVISRMQLDSFKRLLTKQPSVTTVQPVRTNPVTNAEIADLKNKMKNDQDSLSEMGEMHQLRMQMIMDRMAKADNAISNIMKKFSDTAGSIIQNLK